MQSNLINTLWLKNRAFLACSQSHSLWKELAWDEMGNGNKHVSMDVRANRILLTKAFKLCINLYRDDDNEDSLYTLLVLYTKLSLSSILCQFTIIIYGMCVFFTMRLNLTGKWHTENEIPVNSCWPQCHLGSFNAYLLIFTFAFLNG